MPATALQFALLAKQQEIASLRQLAEQIELVDLLGRLIHALQRERGATSIYLASSGKRFVAERAASRGESAPLVAQLRERLDRELTPVSRGGVKEPGMGGVMAPAEPGVKRGFERFQGCGFLPFLATAF